MLERHQDSFPSWFSLLPASRVLLLGWGWERKVEPQAPGAVTARPDRQGWDRAHLDQQQHSFQWLPLGCQALLSVSVSGPAPEEVSGRSITQRHTCDYACQTGQVDDADPSFPACFRSAAGVWD